MEKEIIGYRWKEAHKKYYKAYLSITWFNNSLDEIGHDIQFAKGSNAEKQLKEAGVLDLWFEPVYKLAYKVGDFVVPIKMGGNDTSNIKYKKEYIIGEVIKIDSIEKGSRTNHNVALSKNGHVLHIEQFEDKFRLATPEEIEEALNPKEEIINIGFDVRIKDGKAFHKNDNITEFVKEMIDRFTPDGILDAYGFGIGDVEFSFTGCEKKTTKLSDWKKIYDKIK